MKSRTIIILYIFILGLIPLLWFKGDQLITGTDLNFPIYPDERLQERLYTWFSEIQFGVDRSNNIGSLPYFLVAAFFYKLGYSVVIVEKLLFVFWYTLTGFSMYFLMNRILSDEKEERWVFFAKLFAILMYMVNFYNIFLWERLQMSISTLAIVPVFVGILITVLDKNTLSKKDIFLMSLIFIVGSSLGTQPPIIYVLLMMSFTLYFFYLLFDLSKRKFVLIWSKFKKIFLLGIVALLSSGYWFLPLISFISNAELLDSQTGREVYNVENLLSWTSYFSSFRNVARQLGDVVWFDGFGGAAYFQDFLNLNENILFIILSFLPFTFFILPLVFKYYKNRKTLLIITAVTLVSLFFSKGTHPPFKDIFVLVFDKLPGFWIHRAPWQKFTLFTVIGTSVLGGMGVAQAIKFLLGRKNLGRSTQRSLSFFLSFLAVFVVYIWINHLFVFGRMFPEKTVKEGYYGKFDLGFHHEFPDYLFDFRNYFGSQKHLFNIMVLPDLHTNVYDWGYAGSEDVLNLVLDKGTIFNSYGEGFTIENSADGIYQGLSQILYTKGNYDFSKITGFFNINFILQRNDFRYGFFGDTDSPMFIKNSLNFFGLKKETTYGKWDLYAIEDENFYPNIYATTKPVDVREVGTNFLHVVDNIDLSVPRVLISDKSNGDEFAGEVFVMTAPKDVISTTPQWSDKWTWPEANNTPSSLLYPLVRLKERLYLSRYEQDTDRYIDNLLWLTTKRAEEVSKFRNLPDNTRKKILNDFIEGQQEILELVKNDLERTPSKRKYSRVMLEKVIGYYQKAIFTLDKDWIPDETKVVMYDIYNTYFETAWVSELLCEGFCYGVDIEYPGNYQIDYVLNDYSGINFSDAEILLRIGDVRGETFLDRPLSGLLSKPYFESGNYTVSLKFPEMPNLLDDIETEHINLNSRDNLLQAVNELHLLLNIANIANIERFNIEGGVGANKYDLSFDYTIDNGVFGAVVIEESADGQFTLRYKTAFDKLNDLTTLESSVEVDPTGERLCEDYVTDECSKKTNISFESTANSKTLHFYVFTYAPKLVDTEFVLRDLSLKEIINPNLVLKRDSQNSLNNPPPALRFYKISPTKYRIKLENPQTPFYLVFNQTFDNGWRLYKGGEFEANNIVKEYLKGRVVEVNANEKGSITETFSMQSLSKDKHFKSNYFGNAWYIDPADLEDGDILTLEFHPQNLFYFGILVSGTTLLSTALWFVGNKLRRNK